MMQDTRNVTRRLLAAAVGATTPMALLVATAPEASAAPRYGTAMVKTQRMSDATLKSKQYGWYAKGSRLKLVCHKRGQAVRGYYSPWVGNGGWDNLWYKVSDGRFVADVNIYTGTNNPVVPACAKPPAPAPSSLSKRVDAFAGKWMGKRADYDGYYGGQCVDLFNYYNRDVVKARWPRVDYAHQLYGTYDTRRYTRVSAGSAPRKGDVAVWDGRLGGGHGHVAIVLGTSGSKLVVLNQNNNYRQYVTKDAIGKYGLRGYLRPKS